MSKRFHWQCKLARTRRALISLCNPESALMVSVTSAKPSDIWPATVENQDKGSLTAPLNPRPVFRISSHSRSAKDPPNTFILDSGASHHCVDVKEYLQNIETLPEPTTIGLANGTAAQASHKGELHAKFQGKPIVLCNVLLTDVPFAKVISLGLATSKGLRVEMFGNSMVLRNPEGQVVLESTRTSGLYPVVLDVQVTAAVPTGNATVHVADAHIQDQAQLWHARLGHPRMSTVNAMSKDGGYGFTVMPT